MSYSFYFGAASKDDAKRQAAEKMAGVAQQQPNHKVDEEAAVKAAGTFIDMLRDPSEGEEVYCLDVGLSRLEYGERRYDLQPSQPAG
jgi:hypothetical protein